jgi:hypothetical protein
MFAVGTLLFLLGAGRFIVLHTFGLMDALYCCLAVVPAGLLLLVIAYVVQHAVIASVIPISAAGVLAFSFPVFDVALGLALMGVIASSALSDRNTEALRRYNDGANVENEEGK